MLVILAVCWVLWFMNFSTRVLFSSYFPLIEQEMGLSHGQIGTFILALGAGYSLMLLISGGISGKTGYRNTITGSMLVAGLTLLIMPSFRNFTILSISFFVLGLSLGSYLPAAIPLLTSSSKKLGSVLGIHDSGAPIAMIAMPFIAGALLSRFHWSFMIRIIGFSIITASIILFLVSENTKGSGTGLRRYLDVITSPVTLFFSVLWIMMAFCSAGLFSILPLYLFSERGIPLAQSLYILGLARIGGLSTPVIGILSDRLGHRKFLLMSVSLTGISTLAIPIGDRSILTSVLFIQAVVTSFFFPMAFVEITRAVDRAVQSSTIGFVLFMGTLFGLGVLPKVLVEIADRWSFSAGIMGTGVMVTFLSIITLFAGRYITRKDIR